MKKIILPIALAGSVLSAPVFLHSQNILHTAGAADWTFFYDSGTDVFDVVFRSKGNTVATGLTNQSTVDRPGAASGPTQFDWNFDTLTVRLSAPPFVAAGTNSYYVSPAAGQTYITPDEPDLGIRTRFGGTFPAGGFALTLDAGNSTMPAGAEVALFQFDEFGAPLFQIETATGNFTSTWDPQGHTHWHWGFSQAGDYSLTFNMQGTLTDTGLPTGMGSTVLNFEVVPEPSTVALITGLVVLGGAFYLRRRRRA